jgi:hypothetical protein
MVPTLLTRVASIACRSDDHGLLCLDRPDFAREKAKDVILLVLTERGTALANNALAVKREGSRGV